MGLLKYFLSVKEQPFNATEIKSILIVRQHNQLGDMITLIPLFRGLKETFPNCEITLIASPQNINGVVNNPFISETFSYDKKKLMSPSYIKSLYRVLRRDYDLVLVPATVSISFTSNFLSRLAKGKYRVGPASLNGQENKENCFFNLRVDLDWRKNPDVNTYEKSLEIVKPLGVKTSSYTGIIIYTSTEQKYAEDFIKLSGKKPNDLLIGIHPGAGKPQNRWSANNFIRLISELQKSYPVTIYMTGGGSDKEILDYINTSLSKPVNLFYNTTIPEIAALAALSDLFISTDTGIMHVAGTTEVPLIIIFGPTSPFNWAPLREKVYFLRNSDLIDDVSVEEVLNTSFTVLNK